ncbi:MAG TPA: hypothetical protein PLU24_03440, partial [Candidatus Omnitrophota bacterium]|nr:hypothetical protein [Candidatus Omnitrophota bacterium]
LPASLFSHSTKNPSKRTCINLEKTGDMFICPCFDEPANKCKIYIKRPFDCALYPFLLTKKGNSAFLAFDNKCPYVQRSKKTFKAAIFKRYVKNFLESKKFITLAKNNPDIAGDYGQDTDIELIGRLPLLSKALYGTDPSHPEK